MNIMNKKERGILKKVVEHHHGLLSPADYINGVCQHDTKIAHRLVSLGYVEEVPTTLSTGHYNFYRATEKGFSVFYPIHKRLWYLIKGDVRTVIVAVITSLIITVITLILFK